MTELKTALLEYADANTAELLASLKKSAKEKKLLSATRACLTPDLISSAPERVRTAWTLFLARTPLYTTAQALVLMHDLWGEELHWKHVEQFLFPFGSSSSPRLSFSDEANNNN